MKPEHKPPLMRAAQGHLTDDEIDDALLDSASAQSLHHLAGCEVCSARVNQFRSSMELFNQASLAWSAARSTTLPALPVQRSSRIFATPAGALSFVATLCVGIAVAITAGLHQHSSSPQAASYATMQSQSNLLRPSGAAPDARQQEIAQDNAMLREIGSELDRPEPLPFALYPSSNLASHDDAAPPVRD